MYKETNPEHKFHATMATRLISNLPRTNQKTHVPPPLTSNPILLRSFRFHRDRNPLKLSVNTARGTRPSSSSSSSLQTELPVEEDNPNSKLVLVVGATGGVGQLVVASLLRRNIRSRLLIRDPDKARALFGEQDENDFNVVVGDTRNPEDLHPAMFEGVSHVICCTGTTAFPSKRWDGENTPERVDWEGVRNFVSALPPTVKRLVHVSSVGVTKCNSLPWSVMNLFGVLKYKKMGEDFVKNSGIPFTIIRPGRLTDGPYTSYDLNTLLKATAGTRRAVIIGQGDILQGETSRHVVAEACIQALDIECTRDQIYEINSIEGEGPEADVDKWVNLFKEAATNKQAK